MHKRKKYILYCIICFCFFLVLGFYLFKMSQVKNIFDEMYYAEVNSFFGGYSRASYYDNDFLVNAKEEDMPPGIIMYFYNPTKGIDPFSLNVQWVIKKRTFRIFLNKKMEKQPSSNDANHNSYFGTGESSLYNLGIQFEYHVDKKELKLLPIFIYDNKKEEIIDNPKKVNEILQQYGITKKDIKSDAKFVLKDVILKDWFKLNGNKSKYNLKNWDNCHIMRMI